MKIVKKGRLLVWSLLLAASLTCWGICTTEFTQVTNWYILGQMGVSRTLWVILTVLGEMQTCVWEQHLVCKRWRFKRSQDTRPQIDKGSLWLALAERQPPFCTFAIILEMQGVSSVGHMLEHHCGTSFGDRQWLNLAFMWIKMYVFWGCHFRYLWWGVSFSQ